MQNYPAYIHRVIYSKGADSPNEQFIVMYVSFVRFDSLCLCQQSFSHVEMGLLGLNQY